MAVLDLGDGPVSEGHQVVAAIVIRAAQVLLCHRSPDRALTYGDQTKRPPAGCSARPQIPGPVDLLQPGLGREPLVGLVHLARVRRVREAGRTVGERTAPAAHRHPPVRFGSMMRIELRTHVG
jgi:hypothetical protein